MTFEKTTINPLAPKNEREHYPSVLEWWDIESFFKTVENNKKWACRCVFTKWYNTKEDNGSIFNLTLYDQEKDEHITCNLRTDFKQK